MITQNLHTHTTFDDGQNPMEEMVQAALAAGLTSIGFSVHTPMPFETCWTIDTAHLPDYFEETRRVKAMFRGKIDVFCGAEWDLYSTIQPTGFDYVIGSVHNIAVKNALPYVDNSAEDTQLVLNTYFDGDADSAAEAFFRQYDSLALTKEVDIVGHFDLLTKFDEQRRIYDATSPRYRAAAHTAMDALIAAGKIFEINTGAISRGYRTTPYPSRALLEQLYARGGKITISSDAHRTEDITFGFEQVEALVCACGFTELWQFDGTEFVPVSLKDK